MKGLDNAFTTIGVVGLGVVGSAVLSGFRKRGYSVFGYDKFKDGGIGSLNEIVDSTEVVFLCLPTLYSADKKEYDKTAIHDVCQGLSDAKYAGLVAVKSTVEPGTTESLVKKYANLHFAHNPEFLTARSAERDFDDQPHIVCGKTDSCPEELFQRMVALYKKEWRGAQLSQCSATESESMKIFVNSFYACKVMLFNEYFQLCEKTGVDFTRVRDMMLQNGWISWHHTIVPGPDGKFGFGGACFPKDTNALLQRAIRMGTPHDVLEAAVKENERVRDE